MTVDQVSMKYAVFRTQKTKIISSTKLLFFQYSSLVKEIIFVFCVCEKQHISC